MNLDDIIQSFERETFFRHYDVDWDGDGQLAQLFTLIDKVREAFPGIAEELPRAAELFDTSFPQGFFPDTGMQLDAVEFDPAMDPFARVPFSFFVAFSWPDARFVIIPDVLVLESFYVSLRFTGDVFFAELQGTIALAGIDLLATIVLPSLLFEASWDDTIRRPHPELEPDRIGLLPSKPSAFSLLQQFNSSPASETPPAGSLSLSSFLLLGNPDEKRFVMELGIENLQLGPVSLDIQTCLTYTDGNISGYFWTAFEIFIEKFPPRSVLLTISGEHDGPAEGWQLEGGIALSGVNFVSLFQALAEKFQTPASLHPALEGKDAELRYLYLSFNTATRAFSFSCSLDFIGFFGKIEEIPPSSTEDIQLTIDIDVRPNPDNPGVNDFTFGGQIIFRLPDPDGEEDLALEFDLVFDRHGTGKTLIAAYRNQGGGSVNVGRLIRKLNENIPEIDFSVNLKQAYFIYDQEEDSDSKYLFGAEVDAGISLSNLPLVSRLYAHADDLRLAISPLYASEDFTAAQLGEWQDLLPQGSLALPDKDVAEGVAVDITLFLGGEPIHLTMPIGTGDLGAAGGSTPPSAERSGAGTVTTDGEDTTTWFDLDKSVSIVHLARIGLQYDSSTQKFWMKLDGSLRAGPVTLSVLGLAVGAALPVLTPSFQIKGLGLDFKRGGLEIGGAFLYSQVAGPDGLTYDQYAGMAQLRYGLLNISAIGAYAVYQQHASLFLYAVLNYPIGGPSFFFVTGLALGFGVNRKIVAPETADKVEEFPLIRQALGGGAATPDLAAAMAQLQVAIPPEIGQHFLAVGIHFTSFKLVDSFLLLTVSFGNQLEFDLLGISTLVFPKQIDSDPKIDPPDKDSGPAVVPGPLAKIVMTVVATYLPEEGYLNVRADIDSKSFVISRNCRLHGGFGFRTWFAGPYAGDFVMTLGGYHPDFRAPGHYPSVPRLGFDWQVTDQFLIKGEAYAALTAHALMAGGYLKATFETNTFSAHFAIGANFLVAWKPYHYEANFFAELGVDTPLGSFDVSAEVEVWGPEFSGTAVIDLAIASYHIDFGNDPAGLEPIDWPSFYASFLPADPATIGAFSVSGGLVQKIDDATFVVNPATLSLEFHTAVPLNSITGLDIPPPDTPPAIGIGPMGLSEITSTLSVTFSGPGGMTVTEFAAAIELQAIGKKVPAALWGGKLQPELNGSRFIDGALSGFSLTLNQDQPGLAADPVEVLASNLQYDTTEVEDSFAFGALAVFVPSGQPADFGAPGASAAREAALQALGFNLQTFGLNVHPDLSYEFVEPPVSGHF